MAVLACANIHGGKSYGFMAESNFGKEKTINGDRPKQKLSP